MRAKITRRTIVTLAILYFVSQLLFLINIQFPVGHNFDEFHYVPSAKQFLALTRNQNWEHPPLAKLIMAAGIAMWGDRPIGWRFMSTIFGSLTLVGMYLWALAVFADEETALWVALITLVNQLLYVQARIGMLDTFMFGFLVWGVAAFCATWNFGDSELSIRDSRRLLAFTGLMFGLGIACKWFGVVPWASCLLLVIAVKVMQNWRVVFLEGETTDWYNPALWRGIQVRHWIRYLVLYPLLVYFITFLPFLFIKKNAAEYYGLWDLLKMQKTMYEGQLRVVSSHPYMSHWTDWPLMLRPIWYAFDKEGTNPVWTRGVLLLGNPLIMWGGLVALAVCAWEWLEKKRRDAFLIVAFYVMFYVSWAVIPRKISFYYYYYPAGMTLSLALGLFFRKLSWLKWVFLGASVAMFIYFFPILAALRIPAESFHRWMWFRFWI